MRRTWAPRIVAASLVIVSAGLTGGCASQIVRNGISDPKLAEVAVVPGLEHVRFWEDDVPKDPIAEIKHRTPHMPQLARDAPRKDGRPVVETLALSGGGADGAFGAGLLAGWTARGDRPEFEIVTGVSAGAIIAPFAYLGASEDEKLHRIWTEYSVQDVATAQLIPGLFGGQALTDTTPLTRLVAQYVDRELLDRIAAEYQRGRILMVLTTNLDAQRPVVWNMGEIARSRSPEALEIFRKVILASAAIPAAFPPVNIPVVANGKPYEELHVDGGTTREIFVLPVQAPLKAFDKLYPKPPIRKLYLVKNGKINAEQAVVQQSTLPIAARSIATLIKSQQWSELYRIYRIAKDAGADYNLAAVPKTFTATTTKLYDPQYQKALFEEGLRFGKAGVWAKTPPNEPSSVASEERPARSTPVPMTAPAAVPTPPAEAPTAPSEPERPPVPLTPSPSAQPPATSKPRIPPVPEQPVAAAG